MYAPSTFERFLLHSQRRKKSRGQHEHFQLSHDRLRIWLPIALSSFPNLQNEVSKVRSAVEGIVHNHAQIRPQAVLTLHSTICKSDGLHSIATPSMIRLQDHDVTWMSERQG